MNRRTFVSLGIAAVAFRSEAATTPSVATIRANGRLVHTMQQAANAGGDIVLSHGELPAGTGAAHIRKAVDVLGSGTIVRNQSIEDKGTYVIDADASFSGLDISGATGNGIGAAFRHQSGNLRIARTRIHRCENGVLGPAKGPGGELVMDDCDIVENGTGTGQTHGLYVGYLRAFTCLRSRFGATNVGHHIKSRALQTTILRCEVGTDFLGNESYNIDAPQGGDVRIEGALLRQGPRTGNAVMLNFGGERNPRSRNSLTVLHTVFESRAGGIAVRIHRNADIVAQFENCRFIGVDLPVEGTCVMRDCTHNGRPLRDGRHERATSR